MSLVILDEILKKCKRGCKSGNSSGDILGRVVDTAVEKHIFISALPVSASGRDGYYRRIGKWQACELSGSIVPSAREDIELFLDVDDDALLAFYKGSKIEGINVVNYRTDFTARMQGIIDSEVLSEKRVFIIGAGSVGSKMAMHLVRAGIGKFTIIDFDLVEAANLCRCEYFVSDIGRYKTLALRDRLLDVNPYAEVDTHQQNVRNIEDDELVELIERSDLVVSAADDPAAEHRLNALAHQLVPVVYPALYSRASGGEVIFTMPGSPCYQCVVGTLRSVSETPSRGEWDYTTAGDLKAEPGLGIDIEHVVVIASKIGLALLMGDVEGSEVVRIIDRNQTAIFVSNHKQGMYGIQFEPFGTVWAETEINENCVSCQAREIDDELLSKVRILIAKAAATGFPEMETWRKGRGDE